MCIGSATALVIQESELGKLNFLEIQSTGWSSVGDEIIAVLI